MITLNTTLREALQAQRDEEEATCLALLKIATGNVSVGMAASMGLNSPLMLAKLKAEELIKIKSKRIEAKALEDAKAAYAEAAKRGVDAATMEGATVTRVALVSRCKGRWPTIEQDLNNASRNGLSAAAKSPQRGYWRESAALQWADHHGKILANRMADQKGMFHRLGG